jgi:beta-glucosidase
VMIAIALPSCNDSTNVVALDSIDAKVDDLLSKMTLEEKIGQMNQYNGTWDVTGPAPSEGANAVKFENIKKGKVGSMLNVLTAKGTREAQRIAVEESRLGIPLIFGYDVIHGYKTMMPIPLGESASWDLEYIRKSSEVAAREASAAGQHWTFAPMLDISRDARWGRVMEGSGEDPYLGAEIAKARILGFQGDDLSAVNTIAACAKHFAGYGFAESGKDYNTVELTDHTLRNIVLPPFKAAADAGVATFMNGFNEIGGIPVTGSEYLQRTILKGEWDYEGMMVSDWGSIGEMIAHGYAKDSAEAALKAVTAGSDMDMESSIYVTQLEKLVKDGKVSEALIDDAVKRILRLKFKLGLFDDPYKYCNEERESNELLSEENLKVAREVAKRSIVLLKNEGNTLPLAKSVKSIAVIGSLAGDKDVPLGSWRAQANTNSAVSLLEGIKTAVGESTKVTYAEGYKITVGERSFIRELTFDDGDKSGFAAAIANAKAAEVVIMAIGEDCWQTGEGRSQADISLKGTQNELLQEIYKVNKNVVVVLMTGRPVEINWVAENVPALLETWHLGSEAGNAIADVLFGDYNPSGKLPISFPRSVGQLPIYYNHKNTGRPTTAEGLVFYAHFTDVPNSPLYPFGYGLSYAQFEYSDLRLSTPSMEKGGKISISVDVKNNSTVAGEEVVQLYIRDLFGSATRPVKELKAFKKMEIKGGETKTIDFELTEQDLAYYWPNGKFEAEAGDFDVFVGGNSQDVKKASFLLK